MHQLDPLIAMNNAFIPAPTNWSMPRPAALAQRAYELALKEFDWNAEFSDDRRVWKPAAANLQALRDMRKRLDPDGSTWNRIAPPLYRFTPGISQ